MLTLQTRQQTPAPRPSSLPLRAVAKIHFFEVPAIFPVPKPVFHISDAQASFIPRLGASIIYLAQSFEYSISPSGTLRVFIKLYIRWFVTLALLCCVLGGIGLIAANFIAEITNLLMLAAYHIFMTALYILGAVAIGAILIAGGMLLLAKR